MELDTCDTWTTRLEMAACITCIYYLNKNWDAKFMDNDDSRIRGRLCPSLIGRGNLYDIIVAMATIMTSMSILCPFADWSRRIRGRDSCGPIPSLIGRGNLYDIIIAMSTCACRR
ncbi:unnamed protein product [Ranitomeya imitator]|uniref:Uncharacterized protein n=1 Tax=Ranitomeya imitator TaxID=111125 RepID=A0ABN9L0P8_9NEOB|nr:unnamed protein product [Ranitomeya imitator]